MGYTVQLEPSGHTIEVEPDQTILDAALQQGLDLPHGCRNGACGDCKGIILSGQVEYGEYEEWALSEDEREQGRALLCQSRPRTHLTIETSQPVKENQTEVKRFPAKVHSFRKLTHDVMEVQLKLARRDRFQYTPGQYIQVILDDGRRREFSIANSPLNNKLLTTYIRRVPDGEFTRHIFERMQRKEVWNSEGPFGQLYLRSSNRPTILVAGGTGLGPIKAILEHALTEGSQREFHLFFGVRAKRDLYMTELLDEWARTYPNFHYVLALSNPEPEDTPDGGITTGYIHEVIARSCTDLSDYEGYLAGPPPMVDASTKTLIELGIPEGQIFADSFTYSSR